MCIYLVVAVAVNDLFLAAVFCLRVFNRFCRVASVVVVPLIFVVAVAVTSVVVVLLASAVVVAVVDVAVVDVVVGVVVDVVVVVVEFLWRFC